MAYSPNSPLPDSQEGILEGILLALQQLVSNNALPDPLTRRTRVLIEANNAANQSTNVAQINGVAPLMGVGASGTGSLRTTAANDTIAGIPAVVQVQQTWNNTPLSVIYAGIAVS